MGWYDGNPAHLWQHPPEQQAARYVAFMGGADAVVEKARASFDEGDFRWVAEVASHVVFAEPGHQAGRDLLADALEQLGYGSENGVWRSIYLMGAHELRDGNVGTPLSSASPDTLRQMTPEQFFDGLAIQIDGPAAWDADLTLDVRLTDVDRIYRLRVRNGVLTHSTRIPSGHPAQVTIAAPTSAILGLVAGADPSGLDISVEGDASVLTTLVGLLDPPDPDFGIVEP